MALNRLLRAKRLPPVTRTPLQADAEGAGNGGEETEEEEGEHRRW